MIRASLETLPDLDMPLWAQFALGAVLVGILSLVLWCIERRETHEGIENDHDSVDGVSSGGGVGADAYRVRIGEARDGGRLHDVDDPRATGARDRRVHDRGGHRASVRAEQGHDDARGVRPLPRLDLTAGELVALARYLDQTERHWGVPRSARPRLIASAFDKIERASSDVLGAWVNRR